FDRSRSRAPGEPVGVPSGSWACAERATGVGLSPSVLRGKEREMRSVRSRRSLVLSAILTGLLLSLLTQSAGAARGTTIKAVVVKSWSGCGSGRAIWDDLNTNWSQYGSVPISIDYSYTQLCNCPLTYDSLVASGAV